MKGLNATLATMQALQDLAVHHAVQHARQARPCGQCPWIQPGQPDITPAVRQAAVEGAWFCCHVHLGTCYGARLAAKAK